MALIECKECGQMVSDKAVACPNCGAPVEKVLTCEECGQIISATIDQCPNCGCPINAHSQGGKHISLSSDTLLKGIKMPKFLIAIISIVVITIGLVLYSQQTHKDKSPMQQIEYCIEQEEYSNLQSLCDEQYSQLEKLTPKEKIVLSYAYLCLSKGEDDFQDMFESYAMIGVSSKERENPVLARNIKKFLDLIYIVFEEAPSDTEKYYSTNVHPNFWKLIQALVDNTNAYKTIRDYGPNL